MTAKAACVFAHVDPQTAHDAFRWHREFAAADEHIFPRTWNDYETLAADWRVFCAREADGSYMGLAYFDQDDDTWEVGGLMVAPAHRGLRVGSTLMRLTLGHLLFEEDPLDRGESVVAHVHAENQAPRPTIEGALRFTHRRTVQIPGSELPGLKTDDAGIIHGDEYELAIPDSLLALAEWCEAWPDSLNDGRPARIELREYTTLEMWAAAFRKMAAEHGP